MIRPNPNHSESESLFDVLEDDLDTDTNTEVLSEAMQNIRKNDKEAIARIRATLTKEGNEELDAILDEAA